MNSLLTTTKPFYCANEEVSVGFTIDGVPEKDNVYTVQLSDDKGENFKTLTTVGSNSPLKVILPKETKSGNKYRLRVVASNPEVIGKSTADSLNIKPVAVATVLSKDTSIYKTASTKVNINLTGDAPWTLQTADNQTLTAQANPYSVTLTPTESTVFSLKSVKDNSCGEGFVAGSAKITVLAPLSAEEDANNIFNVFPNPTEYNVTITLKIPSNKPTEVEMIDLQGKSVFKTLMKGGQTSEVINMEKLPAGTYVIHAQQDEKQTTKKVVKIK
ncbi:MAG: T9SS type A sorting domain-containing protein [Arcicella sp.]|nr:T9SS type A sorting domain-containing protein [Arcicella sp.]